MRTRACLGRSQLLEPDLGKRASPPSYINKTTIFRGNKAWASPAFTNSEFRDAVQASVETNFVEEYYGIVWKGLSVFFRFRGWWLLATVSSYCYFSCVIKIPVYINAYSNILCPWVCLTKELYGATDLRSTNTLLYLLCKFILFSCFWWFHSPNQPLLPQFTWAISFTVCSMKLKRCITCKAAIQQKTSPGKYPFTNTSGQ